MQTPFSACAEQSFEEDQEQVNNVAPGLLSEEGPLSKEVCFEKAIHCLHALRC